ncbi:hypothetical protein SSS_06241 [Sarcoptes scabiei]|uniref:C2 domain-containing protein n=2 Tax=Sarcoptes scabiei TaxID=52283 RepID=A0A834VIQ7_SARSC|nr:hypothetical protein SSS_06241 [Sarcoptes scabiei]
MNLQQFNEKIEEINRFDNDANLADEHHAKPPPPYEDIDREDRFVALPNKTILSVSQSHQSSSSSQSKALSIEHESRSNLSIENPMAAVFANPEFDHVELKIRGHINPSSSEKSSDRKSSIFVSNYDGLLRKANQIFLNWKNWRQPEVIVIRLAILLLALLLMIQMARLVLTFSNESNGSKISQEFKIQHSARTGKALTSILDDDIDQHLTTDTQKSSHLFNDKHDIDPILGESHLELDNHLDQNQIDNNDHIFPDVDHHSETEYDSELFTSVSMPSPTTTKIEAISTSMPSKTSVLVQNPKSQTSDHRSTSVGTAPTTIKSTTITTTTTTTPTTTTTTSLPIQSSSIQSESNHDQIHSGNENLNNNNNSNSNNNKTYNITIIIHSANVPDMDSGYLMGRASDTYCNVFIDNVLVGKTPIIDNSNNPNWHYLLPRQFTIKQDTWIRIELMDSDHVRNDHIGGILLNFGDLLKNDSLNKPINMFHGRGYIWVTISSVSS